MNTPWSNAMTVLRWGKWALGLFALNYYGPLIDALALTAAGVLAVAVIADRIRTRRTLHRWNDHCQTIADHHVAAHRTPVTPLRQPEQREAA